MTIETIQTESLGNRGYLIHDGSVGIVIDVQRDYGRWLKAAENAHVKITHVFETHIHNDYVTGGLQLSRDINATYILPAHSEASFESSEIQDNESIDVGQLRITGMHTPGHTQHHMSYKLTDGNSSAVFTGGGVLYGTVGRTDLISEEKTQELTVAQFDSAQRLSSELDGSTEVYPTHGFGSFCSSSNGSGVTSSTMADEKKTNIAYIQSKDIFVRQIIEGLGPYPKYYLHMGPYNKSGPGPVRPLHIHDYPSDILRDWLTHKNSWVIDIRSRRLFAASHPERAVGFELGNSFATYLGWLIPWEDKLLLVGDSDDALKEAYAELSRIGVEQFVDGATHEIEKYMASGKPSSYPIKTFQDYLALPAKPWLLDVRLVADWNDTHIKNSHNIPLHELMARIEEVPDLDKIWVHCASGYRASIAASLLDRYGKIPVLIDDNFSQAIKLGLT